MARARSRCPRSALAGTRVGRESGGQPEADGSRDLRDRAQLGFDGLARQDVHERPDRRPKPVLAWTVGVGRVVRATRRPRREPRSSSRRSGTAAHDARRTLQHWTLTGPEGTRSVGDVPTRLDAGKRRVGDVERAGVAGGQHLGRADDAGQHLVSEEVRPRGACPRRRCDRGRFRRVPSAPRGRSPPRRAGATRP